MSCLLAEYMDVYLYTLMICGILSAVGSSFILGFCIYTKTIQVYSFKLIFYFSLAQLLCSFDHIIPISIQNKSTLVCNIFGLVINSSQMIGILWNTCMAFSIFQIFNGSVTFYERHHKFWHATAWVLIPALNSIPIITNSYSPVGNSCTYNIELTGTIERIFIFYIPVWLLISFCTFCYLTIIYKMKTIEISQTFQRIIKRLMYYPVIVGFNVILITAERVCLYTVKKCDLEIIDCISAVFISLAGFFNFLVFILTPGNLDLMKHKINPSKTPTDEISELSSLHIHMQDGSKVISIF